MLVYTDMVIDSPFGTVEVHMALVDPKRFARQLAVLIGDPAYVTEVTNNVTEHYKISCMMQSIMEPHNFTYY